MNKKIILLSIILCALSSEYLVAAARKKAPTPAQQQKPAPITPKPGPGPAPIDKLRKDLAQAKADLADLADENNKLRRTAGGGAAGMEAPQLLAEIRRLRSVIKDIAEKTDVSASGVTNENVLDVVARAI